MNKMFASIVVTGSTKEELINKIKECLGELEDSQGYISSGTDDSMLDTGNVSEGVNVMDVVTDIFIPALNGFSPGKLVINLW